MLKMCTEAVPIDEFSGLVFGVAEDFVYIVQFVGVAVESEVTDAYKQCRDILNRQIGSCLELVLYLRGGIL